MVSVCAKSDLDLELPERARSRSHCDRMQRRLKDTGSRGQAFGGLAPIMSISARSRCSTELEGQKRLLIEHQDCGIRIVHCNHYKFRWEIGRASCRERV